MLTKNKWLLPTNTINMRMIVAQGLITSPDGFKKYYSDVLELCPGWIPLFKNKIQTKMLEKVVSEREGLVPCIMEFTINEIIGTIKVIQNNELIDISVDDIDNENIDVIFILAPLPLTVISQILFQSINDKNEFADTAINRSNVILSGIALQSRKIDQILFITEPELNVTDISILQITEPTTVDYNKIYSLGGMLAAIFYYTKNGSISNDLFTASISSDKPHNCSEDHSIILNYFYDDLTSNSVDLTKRKTYDNLINAAINRTDFKEAVVEFLRSYALSFAEKLQKFDDRSDKPISEEFSATTTLLQKALLMLFLREDTESLIDYDQIIFSEEEYVIFAMLFGIRDKFIKIPKFIREYSGLQNFISVIMANCAHSTIDSHVGFKKPNKPSTIIDMLNPRKLEFILWASKQLGLQDCFAAEMPNKYFTNKNGKSTYSGILLPKIIRNENEFYSKISRCTIGQNLYNKISSKFLEYEKWKKS